MAWTSVTIAAGSGDSVKVSLESLWEDAQQLRKHEIGTSAPGSLTDGILWADNTTVTRILWRIRGNSAWGYLVGWDYTNSRHILEADFDCDKKQLHNLRLVNRATGSLTAAGAANKGMLEFDSTLERWCGIGTSKRVYLGECDLAGTTYAKIPCSLNVGGLGTPATASTALAQGGWLMDGAGEQLNVVALQPVPTGFTDAHDLTLVVTCALAAAETNGDDIDIDGEWRAVTPGTDAANKTATGFAAVAQDIGTASAQYSVHDVTLTVDYDDVTNPVDAGDWLQAVVNRDGLATVAGIVIFAAHFRVPVLNFSA